MFTLKLISVSSHLWLKSKLRFSEVSFLLCESQKTQVGGGQRFGSKMPSVRSKSNSGASKPKTCCRYKDKSTWWVSVDEGISVSKICPRCLLHPAPGQNRDMWGVLQWFRKAFKINWISTLSGPGLECLHLDQSDQIVCHSPYNPALSLPMLTDFVMVTVVKSPRLFFYGGLQHSCWDSSHWIGVSIHWLHYVHGPLINCNWSNTCGRPYTWPGVCIWAGRSWSESEGFTLLTSIMFRSLSPEI